MVRAYRTFSGKRFEYRTTRKTKQNKTEKKRFDKYMKNTNTNYRIVKTKSGYHMYARGK